MKNIVELNQKDISCVNGGCAVVAVVGAVAVVSVAILCVFCQKVLRHNREWIKEGYRNLEQEK